jgi:ABC-type polysaccharide/polyol phosphate transport system ATPase subunit
MAEAVVIDNLHKSFRLYHETQTLKGALLSMRNRRSEIVEVLRGISLTVPQGQTVGIIGRNGVGKSTLLGILGRIYQPTAGRAVVNGRVATLLELGAGFHPELTGIENVYLNGAIMGMKRREIAAKLNAIVEFAEIGGFIDSPVKSYSDGMVMRLGFSIVVHADADVLLVDEVIAVGDQAFQQKCYDRIGEFQRAGKTILLVSHDMAAVRRVADRAVWLEAGQVAADGEPDQVSEQYIACVRPS